MGERVVQCVLPKHILVGSDLGFRLGTLVGRSPGWLRGGVHAWESAYDNQASIMA